MSMLQAALTLAAKGLRVFPIREGTKDEPLCAFTTEATTDPLRIRAWWCDPSGLTEYRHNIGVNTTGFVVADIDTKGGKPGFENYLTLGLGFDSFTVRTPSGGYHVYYGPYDAGQSPIAEGVDIRSHNGYVVGPGSVIDGKAYTVEIDTPMQPVPPELQRLLRAPQERGAAAPSAVDPDRPDAIAAAAEYLAHAAPLAIEGQNGNDTTYRVVQGVKDRGVSEDLALGLLLEHWNERCEPPWGFDELHGIVRHAYEYGHRPIGAEHPEAHFGGVVLPAVHEIPVLPNLPSGAFMFGRARDVKDIKPRDWIVNRLLLRRYVSGLAAPGGASKSTQILTLAAHMALGLPYAGFKLKQGKSIIYNAEDDLDEQHRRLHAICAFYRIDYYEVIKHILLLSEEEFPFKLATGAEPTIASEHIGRMVALCAEVGDVNMIALDPFVNLHDADVNDPVKMRYVVGCANVLARQADVGVLVALHTKKPSGNAEFAGNVDSVAGTAAITNAMRIAVSLAGASEKDCERWAIPENERHEYVRMDDAKMNLTLRGGEPVWFRKHGVKLANGDEVGVVQHVDNMGENVARMQQTLGRIIITEMTGAGSGSVTLGNAVGFVMQGDPLYGQLGQTVVKERMRRYFAAPVNVDGNLLVLKQDIHGSKSEWIFTIE